VVVDAAAVVAAVATVAAAVVAADAVTKLRTPMLLASR
jgi:hypothetical protein